MTIRRRRRRTGRSRAHGRASLMDLTSAQFCERASIPLHAVGHIRRNIPNFPCVKGRGGRGPTGDLMFSSLDADALASLMGLGFSLTESAKIIANFRSEEHTSELQSRCHFVCLLLLEQ